MNVAGFWTSHVAAMADHFAAICAVPECKVEYWRRVQRLAKDEPWIYADLPDLVVQRAKEIKHAGVRR